METCAQHFISHGALQRMLGGIDISYGNKHTRAAIARDTHISTRLTHYTQTYRHTARRARFPMRAVGLTALKLLYCPVALPRSAVVDHLPPIHESYL
jgi:hypothetical protein